jgi:hypothetical protein
MVLVLYIILKIVKHTFCEFLYIVFLSKKNIEINEMKHIAKLMCKTILSFFMSLFELKLQSLVTKIKLRL